MSEIAFFPVFPIFIVLTDLRYTLFGVGQTGPSLKDLPKDSEKLFNWNGSFRFSNDGIIENDDESEDEENVLTSSII